ncbi:AAA family ATPase [Thalassotalea sp. PS06]|uniref:AAA family ATPase n=1 Tax=Thalassotalea sp. PS06 TaxID=2594005 RepID=UPI0039190CCC
MGLFGFSRQNDSQPESETQEEALTASPAESAVQLSVESSQLPKEADDTEIDEPDITTEPVVLDEAHENLAQARVVESQASLPEEDNNHGFASYAPKPGSIEETGLHINLLLELLIKHIYRSGVSDLQQLSKDLCLSGSIVKALLDEAKQKAWVENPSSNDNGQFRYSLSNIGTLEAEKAFLKRGYLGPAPIPLELYQKVSKIQSNRTQVLTEAEMREGFGDLVFPDEVINSVGPALNSTKPILIYGGAGTGKSYFCRHLNRLFGETVLIPYAIEINNEIIQVFDPELHHVKDQHQASNVVSALRIADGYDRRWLACERPLLVTGGELTLSMLEVQFDNASRCFLPPIQLKANNGILFLDDLGRQRVTPKELFNRWILPLEERRDFLALQNGQHFEVPFELLLLFSTNLTPQELIDDAFLRRLGYKIQFQPLSKELYQQIWFRECERFELNCDNQQFDYLINMLHQPNNKPYLACYPRDILSIVRDQVLFKNLPNSVNRELIDFAWQSYFVA